MEKEKLTLEMLKAGRVSHNKFRSDEVYDLLDANGYLNLGWTNGGLQPPLVVWDMVYKNERSTITIYVNHETKQYYSEDSGD